MMEKLKQIKWGQVVIAFLLGFVLAVGTARWRFFHRPSHGQAKFDRMLNHFSHKLHLTDEQKKQVAAIFEANHKKIEAIHLEIKPRMDEVRDNTREEIRKILKPEQIAKFEELDRKMEERRKRRPKVPKGME